MSKQEVTEKARGLKTPFGTMPLANPLTMTPERILPKREEPKPKEEDVQPDKETPEVKKPTAASVVRGTFLDLLGTPKKPGEKEETEEEKKARDDAAAAEKQRKDDDEKARKEEEDRVRRESQMTPERIAEISAAAAGAVVEKLGVVKPPAEKKDDDEPMDELPERYRDEADTYTALAEINPEKYKDVVQRIASSDRKEQAYIAKWKREHPGEEFDADAEEHNEFYDKIEVRIPEADLKAAKEKSVDIRAARVTKETIDAERRKEANAARSKEVSSAADRRAGVETLRVLADVNPKYDLLGKSPDEQKQILEAIEKDRVVSIAFEQLSPIAAERFRQVELLSSGGASFDAANQDHVAIVRAAKAADESIRKLPEDKRVVEGKRYVSPAEFGKMDAANRSKCWTIGPDDISAELRREFAELLRQAVKNTVRMAREIAGLPPEEETREAGLNTNATSSHRSTFARAGVMDSSSGRVAPSRRAGGPVGSAEDSFFKNVGGS